MPVNPCRCIVIRLRSWNHQGQTGFDGLLALRRCPSGSDRRGGERSRQRYDGHPLHRSPAVPARFGRPLPGCVSGRIDEARPILSGATTAPCYGPAFTASILHDAGATDLEGRVQILAGLKGGERVVVYSKKALNTHSRINIMERIVGKAP